MCLTRYCLPCHVENWQVENTEGNDCPSIAGGYYDGNFNGYLPLEYLLTSIVNILKNCALILFQARMATHFIESAY